jgi:ubiquitin-protein ligase
MSHVEVQFVNGSRALIHNATVELVTPVNDAAVNWRALWLQYKKFTKHVPNSAKDSEARTDEIHAEIEDEEQSRDSTASDTSSVSAASDTTSNYDSDEGSWDEEFYLQIVHECVDYHVGQVVEVSQGLLQDSNHVPEEQTEPYAQYTEGNFCPRAHKYGVVTRVIPAWAGVTWLAAQQLTENGNHVLAPPRHVPVNSLHVLQYSQPYTWQLGDWCLIVPSKLGNNLPPSLHGVQWVTARIIRTRTYVDVKWQDGTVTPHMDSTLLRSRDHLLECDFQPDDFVTRADVTGVIQRVNAANQTAEVLWLNSDLTVSDEHVTEQVSIYDLTAHSDFSYQLGDVVLRLPSQRDTGLTVHEWLGEVTALQGPRISAQWTSGVCSDMLPSELFVLSDEYNEEESEESDEEYDEESEESDEESHTDATHSEAQSSGLLWSAITKLQQWLQPTSTATSEEAMHVTPVNTSALDDNAAFEVLEDTTQHHFAARTHVNITSEFCNLVMKEWTTLQQNITPGIYIKVFESRIDLLKALIVGPKDTPYYQSPFVFDIYLPDDYPQTPPAVHYYSKANQKLHPNLNTDGSVCLSLLGTWITKSTSEDWNAETSNLLQLLLSLQGLVLGVREPYFLEAGYDKLRGTSDGIQQSRIYNERALILSVQHMIETLRGTQGPAEQQSHPEFNAFIVQHFTLHGHDIVHSLRALYLSAHDPHTASPYAVPLDPPPTAGFVLALTTAVNKLETLLAQLK